MDPLVADKGIVSSTRLYSLVGIDEVFVYHKKVIIHKSTKTGAPEAAPNVKLHKGFL